MSHRSSVGMVVLVLVALLAPSCSNDGAVDSTTSVATRPARSTRVRSARTSLPQEPSTTTTTAAATTTTGPPPNTSVNDDPSLTPGGATGTIGVIGCSNTRLAVAGYTDISSIDKLIAGDLGGGSLPNWGNPLDPDYSTYWSFYDDLRPASGYDEAWFQICMRAGEHGGAFNADQQAWISHAVEQLHVRDPGIPIWISGLNTYEGVVCTATGEDGPAITIEAAAWGASTLPLVYPGPVLGPLLATEIVRRDDCHPNGAGEAILGEQLVEFFD